MARSAASTAARVARPATTADRDIVETPEATLAWRRSRAQRDLAYAAFPYLEPEDIRQSLQYAAWLAEESVRPLELATA